MTTVAPRTDHSSPPPYPIRPITAAEFDAFHNVAMHAFHSPPQSDEERRLAVSHLEFDRTLAAFDGGLPVGTAGVYSFRLAVPGSRVLPAAGVTWVSVLPSHRRRGVLTAIMRRQLTDIRDRGEPIAVLWASESLIYPRYGYGRAMWRADLTLHRGEGALAARVPADAGLRLRLADPASVLPELAKVYDTVLPWRPGFIARDEAWWRRTVYDPPDRRQGGTALHCVLAEDDDGPRGYALYSAVSRWDSDASLPDGIVNVREMVAIDAATTAALATDLFGRDLTTEFRLRGRPVDDPLLYQLADPRRARTRLKDALWTRIIDVPGALAQRRYSAPADVVLEVRDALLPANAGRWRLTTTDAASDGSLSAICVAAADGDPADVTLDITELGAAYLGGTTIGALAGAGLVTEGRAGAIRQLSTALAWEPAPWCPVDF
jgi:predicted acetyltransferase